MAAALVGWMVGGTGRGGLLLCFYANVLVAVHSAGFSILFFQEPLHERFICPVHRIALYINIFPSLSPHLHPPPPLPDKAHLFLFAADRP